MYFLQVLINKLYNLWGGGCRKHTPPTYHTANSIPQHAKRENRKILNGGTAQNVENFTPAAYYDKNEAKGEGSRRGTECTSGVFAGIMKQDIRQGQTSGTMQASSPTDCI